MKWVAQLYSKILFKDFSVSDQSSADFPTPLTPLQTSRTACASSFVSISHSATLHESKCYDVAQQAQLLV